MLEIEYCDRWKGSKLLTLFFENTDKNTNFAVCHALQFYFGTIIPKKEYALTDDLIETYRKYTLVRYGDIVINGLNLNYDFVTQRVGLVREAGIITSAYVVLRARNNVNPEYYCYLFKALDARKMFNGIGTGIRLTLSHKDIKYLELPVPPIEEQQQIVKFLDRKISQIDKLISIRKYQITDLEDLKKAAISRAVTRGLNPNAPLRDSGVQWLGEIPLGWEVMRIKKVVVSQCGGAWGDNLHNDNNDLICMRVADFDFSKGRFRKEEVKTYTKRNYSDTQIVSLMLRYGDILVEKSGGGDKTLVGRAVLFDLPFNALFANFMDRLRVNTDIIVPEYFLYYWKAMYSFGITKRYIKQTIGIQNLNISELLSNEVVSIPDITEQKQIAEYLDKVCSKIDSLILNYTQQIETLNELKARLIYDTVTGKIDVRNIMIPKQEGTQR